VLQALGGEVQERRVAGLGVVARAEPGAEEPGPLGAAQAGGEGEVVAVLVGDAEVSRRRMAKGTLLSLRNLIQPAPTNSRSASSRRMLATGKCAR
jgi:hypothetical protein